MKDKKLYTEYGNFNLLTLAFEVSSLARTMGAKKNSGPDEEKLHKNLIKDIGKLMLDRNKVNEVYTDYFCIKNILKFYYHKECFYIVRTALKPYVATKIDVLRRFELDREFIERIQYHLPQAIDSNLPIIFCDFFNSTGDNNPGGATKFYLL